MECGITVNISWIPLLVNDRFGKYLNTRISMVMIHAMNRYYRVTIFYDVSFAKKNALIGFASVSG